MGEEVVQNPIRARMCGFGDKDRRPLAPAAVAKMHVQRPDSSLVDVDEVDCSFFLVTVDLWSADGTKEMNLVLHPTSADRYTPANAPKSKRRATTSSTAPPSQPSEAQSPVPPTPSTSQYQSTSGMTPYMAPASPTYNQQAYPFPAETASVQDSAGYQSASQPFGPPALPSIHTSMGRNETQGALDESNGTEVYNSNATSAPWQTYTPLDNQSVSHGQEVIDPALRAPQIPSTGSQHPTWSTAPVDPYARYVSVPNAVQPAATSHPTPSHHTSPVETSMYASASYAQQQQEQQHQQQAQAQAQSQFQQTQNYTRESTPPSTIPPLPRHTYTRTLVGPLSANACRLLDEHRKPGIFFLFQDLSIRTEGVCPYTILASSVLRAGQSIPSNSTRVPLSTNVRLYLISGTFRLRLRLMNVGAPPAPDLRAYGVHTDQSPVLAQTFTEPFVVFSAKRFPGVPDTTALSIALGNQGQKLPLRNRNNKQGRKRQRNGSDESGEDSD
ncbi:hypothetical protein BC629DRAFT_1594977 [Irpex lacteus]|nr:hypothetical protein BC629DRAFT_1594977 [Irpex lacteus]